MKDIMTKTQFIKVLSMVVVVATVAFNFLPFFVQIPQENREIISSNNGVFNTMGFVVVIAYWLGSSNSKQQSTEITGSRANVKVEAPKTDS